MFVGQLPARPIRGAEMMASALVRRASTGSRAESDGTPGVCPRYDVAPTAVFAGPLPELCRRQSFLVVDVETQGSLISAADRITEIAVVLVAPNGAPKTLFSESLINSGAREIFRRTIFGDHPTITLVDCEGTPPAIRPRSPPPCPTNSLARIEGLVSVAPQRPAFDCCALQISDGRSNARNSDENPRGRQPLPPCADGRAVLVARSFRRRNLELVEPRAT